MCASVYSSLLLYLLTTTFTIFVMCGTKMATEGLPVGRREHGADNDILAGADFLSVFIESSLRRAYSETTTTATTTLFDMEEEFVHTNANNYIRPPRETSPFAQTDTEQHPQFFETTVVSDSKKDISDSTSNVKDGVIVAVRVSSSVGRTVNKKLHQPSHTVIEKSTLSDTIMEPPTTELLDQSFVASQEHPSIIAKSSKSELNVEEIEPITRDRDLESSENDRSYPASVHALPSASHSMPFHHTPGFLSEELTKDVKQPFHQAVIYHDNPREPGRARSVSYSTLIQHSNLQTEMEKNPQQYERRERNYNGAQNSFINTFNINGDKRKIDGTTLPQDPASDIKSMYVTSTPQNWKQTEEGYDESTKQTIITTERNWETQEKPYSHILHLPKVYGEPEQNYEIDEAVSVVTNGRTHGLQSSSPPGSEKVETKSSQKKGDDNQKVGYVVEGRDYRKYRVEERTADGFIVGEYGVVSHNDGSLRGVRYTADGTINPRLIYDALMKFLSL